MPVDRDRWYQNQIDLGNLPDENGYYHYTLNENKSIKEELNSLTAKIIAQQILYKGVEVNA